MPESAEERTKKYLDLGHSEAENHAKTQLELYEKHVKDTSSVTNVVSNFFKTNLLGFAWHYLKSRFGPRHPYQAYPRNGDTGIYSLQSSIPSRDKITIALLSDWASDTAESDAVAHLVARYAPDYTIHMGDIYFVGAPKEVEANFTAPHASWYYGASGSLALSGNHEMYSNGNAFFQHLLPAMYIQDGEMKKSQQAGFFCLENAHWRIIGIDTGYTSVGRPFIEILSPPDCHLKKEQVAWLRDVVQLGNPDDKRGIVFLSHHPYISSFREDYAKPGEQIRELMGQVNRPVIWIWGHDHRLVVYNFGTNGKGPQAYGRCIGHGGLPVETAMPAAKDLDKIGYYDRRVRKVIKRHSLGYNGFARLLLKDDVLTAEYRDLEDQCVFEESWTVNTTNGQLEWKILQSMPELAVR
ncbi:metallophosphoesterase [Dyadobacter chenwenxiniae]|uniref:Metallophosphoesterase n=1 Tax=Dyadobacter chenwenxiniae TaxID=2906456 RepID=A0A9X1TDT8_9BACT|nr:metallophosphoesterase [Dyadobacter chenwenxiniae]MCF0061089.1 metallophosphoesterase [Dyadobacter chenwenxiniae]UON80916.1 metallophosphoesterase [Dyadobacter chenwenxiniae]